jgi:putative tryptophan/tyrosine transport system substrate-binding protein
MRRRGFITLLGGAAAWPLVANAQQPKRVGVLMNGVVNDPINQSNLATLIQGLRKLGWTDGQNLQIEVRWSAADPKFMEAYATDLVGMFKPDVLLTVTTGNLLALQRITNTIPIIFIGVSDPVEQGLVPNLTKPGGNISGFANPEFSIAGKWTDLLKQMVPTIARVAFVDPGVAPHRQPQDRKRARHRRAARAAARRRRGDRMMKRREFITLLGGAGAAWAQQLDLSGALNL